MTSRTDIVRYQGASGDFNPIHHDDNFARSAGMPGVFSVRAIAVRFAAQVWPGDRLTCSGTVRAIHHDDGVTLAELDLAVTRGENEVAVSGTATVDVTAVTLNDNKESQ